MKHNALGIGISLIMIVTGAAQAASEDPPPIPARISLECVEQPARQVQFGDDGQVHYGETSALMSHPVTLTVIRIEPTSNYAIEPARIDSEIPWLRRERAVWTREDQIDADNGRLRINLATQTLLITEVAADGNARFRRFVCQRQTEPSTADAAAD